MLKTIFGYVILILVSAAGGIFAFTKYIGKNGLDTSKERSDIARYQNKIDSIGIERTKVVDSIRELQKKDVVLIDSIESSKQRLVVINVMLKNSRDSLENIKIQAEVAREVYIKNYKELIDLVKHPANRSGESLLSSLKKKY